MRPVAPSLSGFYVQPGVTVCGIPFAIRLGVPLWGAVRPGMNGVQICELLRYYPYRESRCQGFWLMVAVVDLGNDLLDLFF